MDGWMGFGGSVMIHLDVWEQNHMNLLNLLYFCVDFHLKVTFFSPNRDQFKMKSCFYHPQKEEYPVKCCECGK